MLVLFPFVFRFFWIAFFGGERITSQEEATRRKGIGQGKGSRRQYTNKSEKSGHVSPAIVEKYLGGIHYPTAKQNLVSNAKGKGAPSNVMDLIGKLPDKTYTSPIDITKEIGKIE